MEKEQEGDQDIQLSELERLIKAFRENFKAKTSDAENFITIHEIERMWGELQQNTLNIYSDMVRELMSSVDERDLIRKKNENMLKEESNCEHI
jgi:hypothetical protein